jgi:ribosomal protein S18 acetylase RimI-like enzyme
MIEVRTLSALDDGDLRRIITGYTAAERYRVEYTESEAETRFTLRLEALRRPVEKRYPETDAETMERYRAALPLGFSVGAYDGGGLVGLAIAEPQAWNNSLSVWEFHVAPTHRGQGIGRRLMEQLVNRAQTAGLRVIVCETQSTNVPAIHFYRRMGFRLEGIDLSYYTNADWPDGEVAVFMKRRLE